jgi:thiamine pyrophosphate-dependent enzyme
MLRPRADRYGSDWIVELPSESGVDHVAFNPGASFRGIHDSLVHTPGAPDLILCMHEAIAVSMAQGYAKAAGKPMAVLLHNVVGLRNASMAIYNAWCGSRADAAARRDRAEIQTPATPVDRLDPHRIGASRHRTGFREMG